MTKLISTLVGYTVIILVVNGIMMLVYNSIIPALYGFKPIGYWQMFGVYIICTYLFKSHTTLTSKRNGKND